MSIQAMVWAIKHAPVQTAQEAMILVAMADQANEDGTEFRRSMKWLAPRARCSVSTLHRHMKRMEERGVIRRGDQSLARADEGGAPVVWDLVMDAKGGVGQTDAPSVKLTDPIGHPRPTPSVTVDRQEIPSPPCSSLSAIEVDFATWWQGYPKKDGRIAAVKAYAKARKRASAQQLTEGLERYRQCRTVREGYVKNATTWLNGGHWEDEPDAPPDTTWDCLPTTRPVIEDDYGPPSWLTDPQKASA